MDAKTFTGTLIAVLLAAPIIAAAPPGTLALIEVGLIGLLYVVRRRRMSTAANRRISEGAAARYRRGGTRLAA